MAKYICTNCGSERTEVRKTRPSLDDRYALGYCGACSGNAENRIERQLCRSDAWDPALLTQRKQAKAERKLLQHVTGPAVSRKGRAGEVLPPATVTDSERERAHEIQRRQAATWGDPVDVQFSIETPNG